MPAQVQNKSNEQPALPGMAAGLPRRPHCYKSKTWTSDENEFAERMIRWWNECFKTRGVRANSVHRNRSVAIKVYRWLHRDQPDSDKMTEGDIEVAIKAYSQDRWVISKCCSRFQSFGDWFRGCPDNVDKQLSRLHKSRGASSTASIEIESNSRRAKVGSLLKLNRWGELARSATDMGVLLKEYVAGLRKLSERKPVPNDCYLSWLDNLQQVIAEFDDLDEHRGVQLIRWGAAGVCLYFKTKPNYHTLLVINYVHAIAYAILDRDDSMKARGTPS